LHVHHLYRTTDDPWEEPDLHLLTLCRLCHEQQPGNPNGGFENPRRLYVTDEEWWKENSPKFSIRLQEETERECMSGSTIRQLEAQFDRRRETIHFLRLEWDKSRTSAMVLQFNAQGEDSIEKQNDEMWVAYETGGHEAVAEILLKRKREEEREEELNRRKSEPASERQLNAIRCDFHTCGKPCPNLDGLTRFEADQILQKIASR
jgi:hypothetical protein